MACVQVNSGPAGGVVLIQILLTRYSPLRNTHAGPVAGPPASRNVARRSQVRARCDITLAGPVAGPPHPSSAQKHWNFVSCACAAGGAAPSGATREQSSQRIPKLPARVLSPDRPTVLGAKALELRQLRLRGGWGRPVRHHPRAVI